jgi:hypothetical protein
MIYLDHRGLKPIWIQNPSYTIVKPCALDQKWKKEKEKKKEENLFRFFTVIFGQVNLISRLSSRVTKKYGVGGRILFHNFL